MESHIGRPHSDALTWWVIGQESSKIFLHSNGYYVIAASFVRQYLYVLFAGSFSTSRMMGIIKWLYTKQLSEYREGDFIST